MAPGRGQRRPADRDVRGGCEVVDNPSTKAVGLTQLALPWALGGYEYGGSINQIFHGYIGDVRIVNRPLSTDEFMIAGQPPKPAPVIRDRCGNDHFLC